MKLSDRIKELRINKNLTQEELSKKSGVSRVAIGNYERGDRNPNIDILSKIAKGLDIDIDVFLNSSEIYTTGDVLKLISTLSTNLKLPKHFGLSANEELLLLYGTSNNLDHYISVANFLGLDDNSLYNWVLYNTVCNSFGIDNDDFSSISFTRDDMKLLIRGGFLTKEPLDKMLKVGLCDENMDILKQFFKDKEKRKINNLISQRLDNDKNIPNLDFIVQTFEYYGYKVDFVEEKEVLISSKLENNSFEVSIDEFLDFSNKVLWSVKSYIDTFKLSKLTDS